MYRQANHFVAGANRLGQRLLKRVIELAVKFLFVQWRIEIPARLHSRGGQRRLEGLSLESQLGPSKQSKVLAPAGSASGF